MVFGNILRNPLGYSGSVVVWLVLKMSLKNCYNENMAVILNN